MMTFRAIVLGCLTAVFVSVSWRKLNLSQERTSWNSSYDFIVVETVPARRIQTLVRLGNKQVIGKVRKSLGFSPYNHSTVGGGPAGCIIANRLSANPNISVLLLEAGPSESEGGIFLNVPIVAAANFLEKNLFWRDLSEKQEYSAKAHVDQRAPHPHGKVLGGSSTINILIYARGAEEDFNSWHKGGATGWSWRDVEPYFLKLENYVGPHPDGMGTNGPVTITESQSHHSVGSHLIKAAKELGVVFNTNYNVGSMLGVGYTQSMVKNGRRLSTSTAYLEPALQRPNLHVLTRAFATKVLIEEDTATGVEFYHGGLQHTVLATKSVILSAGVYNSPHLLMLSGVGPAEQLKKFHIEVKKDLPGVGANLHDHAAVSENIFIDLPNNGISLSLYDFTPLSLYDYFMYGTGFLADNLINTMIFLQSNSTHLVGHGENNSTVPDIHMMPSSALLGAFDPTGNMAQVYDFLNLRKETVDQYYQNSARPTGATVAVAVTKPKSRGSVTLASRNPFDRPLIQANLLQHPNDRKLLKQALNFLKSLTETPTMRSVGAYILDVKHPERKRYCEQYIPYTDEHLECYISTISSTVFHSVGTCKMGTDKMAVVDPLLQVYGVKRLRVADSSIMPSITSGNTQAATMMIAEKAADIILQSL